MRILVLDPKDTVAVALEKIPAGARVRPPGVFGREILCTDEIPPGHKLALACIPPGQPVIKYGECIGLASRPISRGEHVHTHNLESQRGRGDRS